MSESERRAAGHEPTETTDPASEVVGPRDGDSRAIDVCQMLEAELARIHVSRRGMLDALDVRGEEGLAAYYRKVHLLEPSALCLSGGGIRSASFSLGALQAMARRGALDKFHYLSTVSGGGYTGAWLIAWLHRHFERERNRADDRADLLAGFRARLALTPESSAAEKRSFPFEAGLGGRRPPEPRAVTHLRRFSNYLRPGGRTEGAMIAATVLRKLLVNWVVLLPLLLSVVAVPYAVSALAGLVTEDPRAWTVVAAGGLGTIGWLFALGFQTFARARATRERAAAAEGFFLAFAVIGAAGAAWIVFAPEIVAVGEWTIASAGGVGAVAAWVFARIAGSDETKLPSWLAGRLADLGAVLALGAAAIGLSLGFAALTDWLATRALDAQVWRALGLVDAAGRAIVVAATGGAFAVSWLVLSRVDINEVSLHALYRNRLVRAFLRASTERASGSPAFDEADDLALHQLWPKPPEGDTGPDDAPFLFPVLNATLNDVAGSRAEWGERKGLSFTFTPLYIGAHAVPQPRVGASVTASPNTVECGYEETPEHLMLGTAMTISGAAVNPSMGFYTSRAVTTFLSLLNVRLGWWMRPPWGRNSGQRLPSSVWLRDLLGNTRFDAHAINLSDGGHFDNLGLYEMVRRRCRRIIVIDGGEDGPGHFTALAEAVRKIRVDFGVRITFPTLDLDALESGDQPWRRAYVGKIHYSELDGAADVDGRLVYFRAVVLGDEPVDVQSYKARNPSFPHESTADQFFGETQFEVYRRLGEHTIQSLLDVYRGHKDQPDSKNAATTDEAEGESRSVVSDLVHEIDEALSILRRDQNRSTHAGGVLFRRSIDGLEFLLVRSIDHSRMVLPKGHIEPWESARQAARREVEEETGWDMEPGESLGVFQRPDSKVTTAYFLVDLSAQAGRAAPRERFREPAWYRLVKTPLRAVAVANDSRAPGVPLDVAEVLAAASERLSPEDRSRS